MNKWILNKLFSEKVWDIFTEIKIIDLMISIISHHTSMLKWEWWINYCCHTFYPNQTKHTSIILFKGQEFSMWLLNKSTKGHWADFLVFFYNVKLRTDSQ